MFEFNNDTVATSKPNKQKVGTKKIVKIANDAFEGVSDHDPGRLRFSVNVTNFGTLFGTNFNYCEFYQNHYNKKLFVLLSTIGGKNFRKIIPKEKDDKASGGVITFDKKEELLFNDKDIFCLKEGEELATSLLRFELRAITESEKNYVCSNLPQLTVSAPGKERKKQLFEQRNFAQQNKTVFELYRDKIDSLTDSVRKYEAESIINYKIRLKEEDTIDHIFSKKAGFDNSVPMEVIAHYKNLRFMTREANSSKGSRCDITIDQLVSEFILDRGLSCYNQLVVDYSKWLTNLIGH